MPYERTHSKLENLIAEALNYEEIQDGAAQAGLSESILRLRLLDPSLEEKAPRIWDAGAQEIATYDQLENEYEVHVRQLRREEEWLRRSYLRSPKWALVVILVGVSPIFLLTCLLILLLALDQVGLLLSPVTFGSILRGSIFSSVGILTLTVILLFSIMVSLIYIAACRNLYQRYSVSKGRYESRLAEIQRQLESNALAERLKAAEQWVDNVIMEKILYELRSIISTYFDFYDTRLTISSAPGLADGFDPAYEIPTESKDKLHRLLTNMPGGTIGVAGPRGVGKTSLLSSFCSETSTTELNGRPVLSVMTSVPTEYDAREFILHIFSLVCQRVLEVKGKPPSSPWAYIANKREPPLTLSILLSFFSINWRKVLATVLPGLFVGLMVVVFERLITPKPSINLSTLLFGLGVLVVILGVVGLILGVVGLLIWVVARLLERGETQFANQQMDELTRDDPLIVEAYEWQREIELQQSYSSGWAGSFTRNFAPTSVETTAETAVELARHQMSLPDIVDRYRNFLTLSSKDYEIIIVIDELDKVGSEQAQRVLNDVKALFGLEGCYYLVSISESAVSSFERRELPFDDAFDSVFDSPFVAIVHLDYLNLKQARRLLRRRVVGIPNPFMDFCHCMSGGLPSDLIRVCRALFDEHIQLNSGESSLPTLCRSFIRADLKAKLRGTSRAANDIMLEPEATELLQRISRLEWLLDSSDSLQAWQAKLLWSYRDLIDYFASQEPTVSQEPEVVAAKEKIASLSTRLAVYLYHSVTVLEFFGVDDFTLERVIAAERSGELDQLARTRQYYAASPRIAELSISAFRNSYNMDNP